MKYVFFIALFFIAFFLVGCSTNSKPAETAIANPASEKCIADGGKLEIVNNPDGQIGMCSFDNGKVCEEWAYFRGECTNV